MSSRCVRRPKEAIEIGCDAAEDESMRQAQWSVSTQVVVGHVKLLLEAGVPPRAVCVIAPYRAQVTLLRAALEPLGVDARTVDGYQGGERDAVVLSLTRSPRCHSVSSARSLAIDASCASRDSSAALCARCGRQGS
mgnify:CR=1 FL=1